MKNPVVTVIIPCFNDFQNLPSIVEQIKQSDFVLEILIIDDGSNKKTKQTLSKIHGVKIITHPKNLGKTPTLKTGVLNASGDIIAFIDSDLINFTTFDFNLLAEPVVMGLCDATLSFRGKEAWYGIVSGFAIAFTGERVISKKLLLENMDIFNNRNYLIEGAFNQRFFNHYNVRGVYLKNIGQLGQPQKKGLRGWWVNFVQVIDYILFLNPLGLLGQLIFVKKPGFLLKSFTQI